MEHSMSWNCPECDDGSFVKETMTSFINKHGKNSISLIDAPYYPMKPNKKGKALKIECPNCFQFYWIHTDEDGMDEMEK